MKECCNTVFVLPRKKREVVLDLAPMLWYSFGTMASLLQEIVAIYPYINPPTLTHQQSNRVGLACNLSTTKIEKAKYAI